jgi:hypothetical protein
MIGAGCLGFEGSQARVVGVLRCLRAVGAIRARRGGGVASVVGVVRVCEGWGMSNLSVWRVRGLVLLSGPLLLGGVVRAV